MATFIFSLGFVISFFFCFFLGYSSTVGVDYIYPLLQIQERERLPASTQVSSAKGLLTRLIPSHASTFDFQIITKEQCGGESCFIISNRHSSRNHNGPEILISGITGVELAAGLHWYLKHWCRAHVSWDKTGGVQLSSVPKLGSLSRVRDAGVLVQKPVPWNYYQNAVTSSYTIAWLNWKRWEKEIDWMALQEINLLLAFTGQEAIWQKVYEMGWTFTSELAGSAIKFAEENSGQNV